MLCLPLWGPVRPLGALLGAGWYPHMGGVPKGPQIGSCALSRERARTCARMRAWGCVMSRHGRTRVR
nr:MAG TPA: hypothetical protein [Caudoviricetes sp.]